MFRLLLRLNGHVVKVDDERLLVHIQQAEGGPITIALLQQFALLHTEDLPCGEIGARSAKHPLHLCCGGEHDVVECFRQRTKFGDDERFIGLRCCSVYDGEVHGLTSIHGVALVRRFRCGRNRPFGLERRSHWDEFELLGSCEGYMPNQCTIRLLPPLGGFHPQGIELLLDDSTLGPDPETMFPALRFYTTTIAISFVDGQSRGTHGG